MRSEKVTVCWRQERGGRNKEGCWGGEQREGEEGEKGRDTQRRHMHKWCRKAQMFLVRSNPGICGYPSHCHSGYASLLPPSFSFPSFSHPGTKLQGCERDWTVADQTDLPRTRLPSTPPTPRVRSMVGGGGITGHRAAPERGGLGGYSPAPWSGCPGVPGPADPRPRGGAAVR